VEIVDRTFEIAAQQAKATGQAFQIVSACAESMLETTVAFIRASAERNVAMGANLMSTKKFDAAVELHGDSARDSMLSMSHLAAKLADAPTSAAKECQKLSETSGTAALVTPRAEGH